MNNNQIINKFRRDVVAEWPVFNRKAEANEVAQLMGKASRDEDRNQSLLAFIMEKIAAWSFSVPNEGLGKVGSLVRGKEGNRKLAIINAGMGMMGLRAGTPDFVIVGPLGLVIFVEMKSSNGTLSPRQRECQAALLEAGHHHIVPYSAGEALELIAEIWREHLRVKE